ncbi:MAG TPA: hypothetical protein ENI61_06305 [Ignavibacteria bacterium]|nr:hypothetical protein [Ignavibacteria bacterium]
MVEDKKEEKDFIVVSELPQVQTRVAQGNDEKEYDIITRDEALTEILKNSREITERIKKIA